MAENFQNIDQSTLSDNGIPDEKSEVYTESLQDEYNFFDYSGDHEFFGCEHYAEMRKNDVAEAVKRARGNMIDTKVGVYLNAFEAAETIIKTEQESFGRVKDIENREAIKRSKNNIESGEKIKFILDDTENQIKSQRDSVKAITKAYENSMTVATQLRENTQNEEDFQKNLTIANLQQEVVNINEMRANQLERLKETLTNDLECEISKINGDVWEIKEATKEEAKKIISEIDEKIKADRQRRENLKPGNFGKHPRCLVS